MTVAQRIQERPDLQVREERMAKVGVPVDLVAVAASLFDPHKEALRHEIGDDLLRGPLANADLVGDLADPNARVASDAEEHVAVVREDEPGRAHGGLIYGWLLNHGY